MRKIQNTHGSGAMVIEKGLNPVGAIGDGDHGLGAFHPAAVGLDQGGVGKGVGWEQARKIRMPTRLHHSFLLDHLRGQDLTDDERAYFGPLATDQRYHCTIHTQKLLGWAGQRRW